MYTYIHIHIYIVYVKITSKISITYKNNVTIMKIYYSLYLLFYYYFTIIFNLNVFFIKLI